MAVLKLKSMPWQGENLKANEIWIISHLLMLHKTLTPDVGIYVATTLHDLVTECCAMTTKGVSMSPVRFRFNQPFNPTLKGANHWALTRQDGSAAGVTFPILVIGSVWYIRECEGRRGNVLHGYYILMLWALRFPILIFGFWAPYLGFKVHSLGFRVGV